MVALVLPAIASLYPPANASNSQHLPAVSVLSSTVEVSEGYVEARPLSVESWFTKQGAARKRARIKRKGVPSMKDWRFTTLTIADRDQTPEQAFEVGNERMRRFLAGLRSMVGREFKWVRKLEVHEDGFPHWHLCWDYRQKLPEAALERIGELWGLGRCNTRRIRGRDMEYVWKYACKSVEYVPTWIKERKKLLRVIQTSKGFFTEPAPTKARKDNLAGGTRTRLVRSLAERENIADGKAHVVRYCHFTGKPVAHFVLSLPCSYTSFRGERLKRTHRERRPWVTTRGFILSEWELVKLQAGFLRAA